MGLLLDTHLLLRLAPSGHTKAGIQRLDGRTCGSGASFGGGEGKLR